MSNRSIQIPPTLIFIVLVLLVAPSALLQGKNLPMLLFGVMLTAFVVTIVWSKLVLRNIEVRRVILDPAKVGEPYVVRYEVKNKAKKIAAFSVWIEEKKTKQTTWQHYFRKARGWIMEVGAGETVHGEAIYWPIQRGEAVFAELQITSRFPFGMIWSSKIIHQDVRVLIQPKIVQLQPSVIHAISSSGPLGQRSNRRGRGGDDYYGLRELVSGDRLGDIAWKASARRGELVCIQRSHPSLPKIRVVLDLTTPTDALKCENDPRELEEQAITLCASLLAEAVRQEQEVALTVLGFTVIGSDKFHSSSRHLGRINSSLASIDLDAVRLPAKARPIHDMKHAGLIIIRPDRSLPSKAYSDAWYFTASQLPEFQLNHERSMSA